MKLRTVVVALAAVGLGLFMWAYILTDEEYSQRRHFSNAWRTASLVTPINSLSSHMRSQFLRICRKTYSSRG